jgi:hypothetical protein
VEKWKTIIDPLSQSNFRRVSDSDPTTILDRDGFLQRCKVAEDNDDSRRELLMGLFSVRYDFTQHYKS